jgi:copper(I)-binding protein
VRALPALVGGVVVFSLSSAVAAQALKISDAWVRAMPPGQAMTAAYMKLENPGERAVVVTGVEASAGDASLHETRHRDGRVQMVVAQKVEVPAGGSVSLEPGGLHVMLVGLARTPAAGETVTLCLTGTSPRVCVDAPVLRDAPKAVVTRNKEELTHHGR